MATQTKREGFPRDRRGWWCLAMGLLLAGSALACLSGGGSGDCDCPEGFGCIEGSCEPVDRAGPTDGAVGAACLTSEECGGGTCLQTEGLPGGYCTRSCGASTQFEEPDCPQGSMCMAVNEAISTCLDLCSSNVDCRAGYVCATSGEIGACVPSCRESTDCPIDEGCNPRTRLCEPAAPRRIGAPCVEDSQCASQTCVTEAESDSSFPGGYCAARCTADEVGGFCQGREGLCVGLTADDGSPTQICVQACSTGVDCRADYACSVDVGHVTESGFGICFPRCRPGHCDSGESCQASTGLCVEDMGGTSDDVVVDLVEVGEEQAGEEFDSAASFRFELPDDAISFAPVFTSNDDERQLVMTRALAPSGEVLYDLQDALSSRWRSISFGVGSIGSLYPNAPRLNVTPGTYTVEVAAIPPGPVSLDVLVKRGRLDANARLQVPLNLWFTDQDLLGLDDARTDANFQKALAEVVEIYADIGIDLTPVEYHEVPAPARTELSVIQGSEDFDALTTAVGAAAGSGVNLIFVEQFLGSGGLTTLGRSDGIGGPPGDARVTTSGVVVGLASLDDQTYFFASTLAHELGHYLGLFHTSERNGLSFDPLTDTLECHARQDADDNDIVTFSECEGHGRSNLMFWMASRERTEALLSEDQIFVLSRNPALLP